MRAVLLMVVAAIMGSTALVIRNNHSLRRVSRQAPVTPPTTDCICVEYNLCNTNYTLNKFGVTLIDIRRKGPCEHYLDVCCRDGDKTSSGATSRTVATSPTTPTDDPLDPLLSNIAPSKPTTNNPSTNSPSTGSLSPTPSSTNPSLTDDLSSNSPSTTSPSSDPSFTNTLPTDDLSSSISINSPSTSSPVTQIPSSSSPTTISSSTDDSSSTENPDSLVNPPRRVTQDRYQSRGCGFRNVDGVGFRIIGGKSEAQFGEFPWVIALLKDNEKFVCGGSLIHPKVVLTSAHCVRGIFLEKLIARAGEWDRGTTKEVLPHQDRKIAEVIEHEHYHSGGLLNDVALLILKEPMKLTDNVDVICLPTQDFNFDALPVSGWGKENYNSKSEQVIIKKVELPFVSKEACETILRKTRLGPYFELHESFVCAGGKKGQDTCKGDGGSPLMCPLRDNPERYQQAGIVAWGIGCGDIIPGAYVNVAHFRDWIDAELKERSITLSKS